MVFCSWLLYLRLFRLKCRLLEFQFASSDFLGSSSFNSLGHLSFTNEPKFNRGSAKIELRTRHFLIIFTDKRVTLFFSFCSSATFAQKFFYVNFNKFHFSDFVNNFFKQKKLEFSTQSCF